MTDRRRPSPDGPAGAAHGTPATALEHVVEVAAPPERIYPLWTTAAGLASWWGRSADADARPGGELRVHLDGGPVMRGRFLELEPPNRVVFTFGWETPAPGGELPPGSTTVEVQIAARPGGSIVTLRHHGLPVELRDGHHDGWSHFLAVMVATVVAPAGTDGGDADRSGRSEPS